MDTEGGRNHGGWLLWPWHERHRTTEMKLMKGMVAAMDKSNGLQIAGYALKKLWDFSHFYFEKIRF